MTVGELIARLHAYPGDTPVVVSGFDEDGFDHLATVETVRIRRRRRQGGHSAEFDEDNRAHSLNEFEGAEFEAVFLNF